MRLVFLNGWSFSETLLDNFKSSLPNGYELVILDHLYALELDEVVDQIDKHVSTETVLVGWSLGGMLAQYYAVTIAKADKCYGNLRGLVLLNSTPCFLNNESWEYGVDIEDFTLLKAAVEARDSEELQRRFHHLVVHGSKYYRQDRRFLKDAFSVEMFPSWQVLLKGLEYLQQLDLRTNLLCIELPVLGIMGEQDALINKSTLSFCAEQCQSFSGEIIQGMGHFPFGFFAQTVTDRLIQFSETLRRNLT